MDERQAERDHAALVEQVALLKSDLIRLERAQAQAWRNVERIRAARKAAELQRQASDQSGRLFRERGR